MKTPYAAGLSTTLVVALVSAVAFATGIGAAPAAGTSAESPGFASTPRPTHAIAWTQIGDGGAQIARVITDGPCPRLTTDGVSRAMNLRVDDVDQAHDKVCEAVIPAGTTAASLSHPPVTLPVLTGPPTRIAVIGDTGCRLNREVSFQACNDPASWPFARVAARVAAWKPDLVIHVGDYIYREDPCPAGNSGCSGSPYGDNLPTWRADFFDPATSLFRAAPILFLRGNHEICERAGEGWFRYLDPRPFPPTCQQFTDPYAVTFGDLRLVVLDSAAAGDERSTPAETEAYREQFARVAELAAGGAWLVTHKPVWGVIEDRSGGQEEVEDESFEEAIADELPAGVELVVSGHIHLAEVLVFEEESDRPPQLIVGNGGTALDHGVTADLTGRELNDEALAEAETIERFGFLTLEATGDGGWLATERDVDGVGGTTCTVRDRATTCEMAG